MAFQTMTPAQVAASWIQTIAPGLPPPKYPPEFGTLHTPLMRRLLKERDDNRCSSTDIEASLYDPRDDIDAPSDTDSDPRDHIDEPQDNRYGYVDENDCDVRYEREEEKEEKKKAEHQSPEDVEEKKKKAEHHESGAPELTRKERDLERQSLPEPTRRKVVHDCI